MPAYPTHTFFSHLALQALIDERHPLAGIAARHSALFRIAGIAGCDIQCMPYQVCSHCEAPYRHDQKQSRTCLVCKREALKDFFFKVSDGRRMTRRDVERDLYANTHLVLYRQYSGYGVPRGTPPGSAGQPFPQQVIRHLANTLRDAEKVAGRRHENYIAFTLGWFSHVVSDAIFKGVYPHAVGVNFFGEQYGMKMLPAAETLTMTDISHDFGVTWPAWHDELENAEPDGGALKHIVMGDVPERYDTRYWTPEFGKPDPAIGRVIEAVQPLNRKWFRRMYVQPDYRAPSPRLDAAPMAALAKQRFGESEMDLGQMRQYALPTGWYAAFLKGVSIYMEALNAACALARIGIARSARLDAFGQAGVPAWSLWQSVVSAAIDSGVHREPEWGSRLQIDEAAPWLRSLPDHYVNIVFGRKGTDQQHRVAEVLKKCFRVRGRRAASRSVIIGPPAFNPAARSVLCVEDALRLKYDHGLAAVARLNQRRDCLLIAGFSDFGDELIARWLSTIS